MIFQKYYLPKQHNRETIKKKGVIYTPWNIVGEMVSMAAPSPEMTIIEPSCGHGAFVYGLLDYMFNTHGLRGNALLQWFIDKVTCVDIANEAATDLRASLAQCFNDMGAPVVASDFSNVIVDDGLRHVGEYDLCIGNPPYVRTKNIEATALEYLRLNYQSCSKGNIDLYYAFVEKYLFASKALCFIVPNSFLSNASGKTLKALVSKRLVRLIDFKEKIVFDDARTYTCIIHAQRDEITDQFLYSEDVGVQPAVVDASILVSGVSSAFASPVYSGIATLCDQVFLVKKVGDRYFNEDREIEKGVVVPYLKITKQRDVVFDPQEFMIFPYDMNHTIIDETSLASRFPMAYAHLLASKERLMMRDKGKTEKYEAWYAFGRKQGFHRLTAPNIIVVPQLIGGVCLPFRLNIEAALKEYQRIVFTSGYVVEELQNNADCEKLLSEAFLEYAKKVGKPWPGKDEPYYAVTTKKIRAFG